MIISDVEYAAHFTQEMVQSMANDQTPGEEDIDLVTEIQQKLGNLLGLMYSCTGAIQVHLSYKLLHA